LKKFKIINFKSQPKNNFFAPEWDYYLFELNINKVNFANLTKYILKKESEILNLPYTIKNGKVTDGYTGLGKNSTTIRFNQYNVFLWKNENITILKNIIIDFHNNILKYFKQPPIKDLYIQSWVNIMRKGDQIKPHIHEVNPDTYLGGHICVQCKETSTNFINPINQINDPEIYSSINEVGKITLFQNNIPHYTDINNSNNERITIAFDLNTKKVDNNYLKIL